ncbi:Helix-turn-helix [Chlamydia trachomatis]|nr:Helix-turn-helix [Chlamydia trachomatis]
MKEYSAAEQIIARNLAHRLRSRRAELGFTQEYVAQQAGIDRSTYLLMESGHSDRATNSLLNPKLFTLVALAHVLRMTLPEMFAAMPPHAPRAPQ